MLGIYIETPLLFFWFILLILFVSFVKLSFINNLPDKKIKISKRLKMGLVSISVILLALFFIVVDESFWFLRRNNPVADQFWISTVFFVLPMIIGLWTVTSAVTFGRLKSLKNIILVFFIGFMLSLVAAISHDVVFCGEETSWYKVSVPANHDADLFAKVSSTITGMPEGKFHDYKILGAYMFLFMIAELIFALRLIKIWKKLNETNDKTDV